MDVTMLIRGFRPAVDHYPEWRDNFFFPEGTSEDEMEAVIETRYQAWREQWDQPAPPPPVPTAVDLLTFQQQGHDLIEALRANGKLTNARATTLLSNFDKAIQYGLANLSE